MRVYDDFIPDFYQRALLHHFCLVKFDYSVNCLVPRHPGTIIDPPQPIPRHSNGLAAMVYDENRVLESESFAIFQPVLTRLHDEVGSFHLVRVRFGINVSDGLFGGVHQPHIDMHDKHHVLLYYVNDSDGDTVLYEQTHDHAGPREAVPPTFDVAATVTTRQGRPVVFDGFQYHSSATPIETPARMFINVDFVLEADVPTGPSRRTVVL